MAKELERPVRETVTPAVLQKSVWAGSNLSSFSQAGTALEVLAGVTLSAKQVRRMTEQIGQVRLDERRREVAEFQEKPLAERVASPPEVTSPDLGVVMPDGARYQRRDHFNQEDYDGSHWKEDKVGIVLSMQSDVHEKDPHPEFPTWLASADVVREIASLGAMEQEKDTVPAALIPKSALQKDAGFSEFSPKLLSREVIASSECGTDFGHHLEQTAWQQGVVDAPRTAFVADGAGVNWTIHKEHFSQMTGILDLMHALSYAWKAAKALDAKAAYERYATWIWQGNVAKVIDELKSCHQQAPTEPDDSSPEGPIERAMTYFTNHQSRMNYPEYRKQGLPLTSSHIESTIKQINIRMKGTEKFWNQDTGETILQLRADSLSNSQPMTSFWSRWLHQQSGANTYRKQTA